MRIDLRDERLQTLTQDEFVVEGAESRVELVVPLPSVNRSSSHLDVVQDYLQASYIIEELAKKYGISLVSKKWEKTYFPYYLVNLKNCDLALLHSDLSEFIWIYQYPDTEFADISDLMDLIHKYEDKVHTLNLAAPDVIDDMNANLIHGAYFSDDTEWVAQQVKKFPERGYGFWVAAMYNNAEHQVLTSTDTWIVPNSVQIEVAFRDVGQQEVSLLPGKILSIDGNSVVTSEAGNLLFPLGKVVQAVACYEETQTDTDYFRHKLSLDGSLFQVSHQILQLQQNLPSPTRSNGNAAVAYVSEFLDFLVVETRSAKVVIFDVIRCDDDVSNSLRESAMNALSAMEDELNIWTNRRIDWSKFDDELFEQLSYDIVYHDSRFDIKTIRKMGKSRSRDGGRDIEVYTKPRAGETPKKYIFQCKFSRSDSSINTSNVGSISDVIDQYGAEGYGIFCNCYIDAGLYDRLDGIARNRDIECLPWSGFEVERFLQRRPQLIEKYNLG